MSDPNVITDNNIFCRINPFSAFIQNGMGIPCSYHNLRGKQAVVSYNTFCGFCYCNMNFTCIFCIVTCNNGITIVFNVK